MNETERQTFDKPRAGSGLIKHLKKLRDSQDRAALARLRRGLGKQPGAAIEMFEPLRRFLSSKRYRRDETAVFLVAALFAYYPDAPATSGNLGASLRQIKDDGDGIERRFVALLNAEAEDLPEYLRQIVGLLKAKEKPINWTQLFNDIRFWNADARHVQTAWARRFWGERPDENKLDGTPNQDNQNKRKGENQ